MESKQRKYVQRETEWDGVMRETTRFQWYKEQEKQKQTLRINKGQEEEKSREVVTQTQREEAAHHS